MNINTAQRAAKWWANQLRGNATLDNGEHSPSGIMTMGLAAHLQKIEKQKQTPELIDKFELELTKALTDAEHFWCVGVDYHPDMLLQEAADKAGLPLGMTSLPWKTTMWIKDDKISVSCGYGAEIVVLEDEAEEGQ